MWMYDHLQKLFSTEVGMNKKYRPVQQSLNLLKSTTSKRQWLKIKHNSEEMLKLFLGTALPLVS